MLVSLNQGTLRGKENISVLTGKPYYSFLGIPYAKPPIDDLRFQPPVLAEKWSGILDATQERSVCIQMEKIMTDEIFGSEDCLYLNIHTPPFSTETNSLKPVLVFIHGGGFTSGSGSQNFCSADYLINYDVVLVTFNYRLHIFGFLNLGMPNCTGNYGLKDQCLAMKWVKENIKNFGGDPNNITIFGESAGSSSVHYHMLSRKSKGLFHKAILQSGTALSQWAFMSNPIEMAFEFGHSLGFKGTDKEELLHFLKAKSAKELCEKVFEFTDNFMNSNVTKCVSRVFIPSIELIENDSFICDHPKKLLKAADPIPVIIGINDKEGFLCLQMKNTVMEKLKNDFSSIIKGNFMIDESHVAELAEVASKVKQFYLGDKIIDKSNVVSEISDLFTDLYFWHLYDSMDFIIKSSCPVYMYEFQYEGNLNFLRQSLGNRIKEEVRGALHADELGYLFHPKFLYPNTFKFDPNDVKVINNMCQMWTNFAKTGHPTSDMKSVNWERTTEQNPCYLQITSDLNVIPGKIMEKRFSFWKNIAKSMNAELLY